MNMDNNRYAFMSWKPPFSQFNRITNKNDLKQKKILNYQGSLYLDARE